MSEKERDVVCREIHIQRQRRTLRKKVTMEGMGKSWKREWESEKTGIQKTAQRDLWMGSCRVVKTRGMCVIEEL